MTREEMKSTLKWLHDNDYVSGYMKPDVHVATDAAIKSIDALVSIRSKIQNKTEELLWQNPPNLNGYYEFRELLNFVNETYKNIFGEV